MNDFHYQGTELELFEHAVNWKSYFKDQLKRFVHGSVLEVGAGLGGTTPSLITLPHSTWTCLEPDPVLTAQLYEKIAKGVLPTSIVVESKCINELPSDSLFDTILYIDVLEHIEDDKSELVNALAHTTAGGHVCVLSPAHQYLFTPFDSAIGHFRRYNRNMLAALTPPNSELVNLRYLDSVGMCASLGNKLVLQKSQPTLSQIRLWDRSMVPISRYLDPMLGYRLGKSILAIWKKS